MNLREQISIIGNQYKIALSVDALTVDEQNALSRFGDWEIDLGGDFEDIADAGFTFTLNNRERLFPAQFPVQQLFSADDADVARTAEVWLANVIARIVVLQTAALNKDTTTIKDEIVTY